MNLQPVVLNAFAEMLPRLWAEESIHIAEIIGVGSGAMKKDDQRKLLAGWSRLTDTMGQAKPGKPGSREMEAALAGAGIKVVTVPPRSKDSPENSGE